MGQNLFEVNKSFLIWCHISLPGFDGFHPHRQACHLLLLPPMIARIFLGLPAWLGEDRNQYENSGNQNKHTHLGQPFMSVHNIKGRDIKNNCWPVISLARENHRRERKMPALPS